MRPSPRGGTGPDARREPSPVVNRNDRAITVFVMTGHAMFHTYELSIPLFMTIWLVELGVSTATLGLVVGIGYAVIGVGAVVGGVLSDAYGSKRLVLASMLGMGGGFVVLSLATDLLLLAVALVLWGAAASLYHPAGLSLLSRRVKDREMAFAYHGAAGSVGTGLGPLLVALLLVLLDWRQVALSFLVPALAGLLISRRVEFDETVGKWIDDPEPSGDHDDGLPDLAELSRETRALFSGGFVVVLGVGVLVGLYYRGAFTFLPSILSGIPFLAPVDLYGETFDPGQYVYAGLLTIGAFGGFAGGWLSERIETEQALVVPLVLLLASTLLFVPASRTGVAPLVIVAFAIGFFHFMVGPILQELIATYVPSNVHGLSYGYSYLALYGVGAAGASLAGLVLAYADADRLFLVLAGIVGTATAIGAGLWIRPPAESGSE